MLEGCCSSVIDMICMEGVEVVTVNEKVREVEGGVKVEEGPGTSGLTLPGRDLSLITRYSS